LPQSFANTPATAPESNGYSASFSWNASHSIPPLEADDTFNVNSFDLTNAELEDVFMNATQDFWASFPGEVGVGY